MQTSVHRVVGGLFRPVPFRLRGISAGSRGLRELIDGARKEGQLNVMLPSTVTPELVKALEAAMNI